MVRLNKNKTLNLIKFTRFLGVVFFVAILLLYLANNIFTISFAKDRESLKTYTVKSGDTLWQIAREVDNSKDTREIIYEIKKINNLNDFIKPGQVIRLPKN